MPTPYLAVSAPVVDGKLPGTEAWVRNAQIHSNGALWNNGTWVKRDIRGKPGQISNHAKGIAMDLSYRYMPASNKGGTDGRTKSLAFIRTCLEHYEQLGVMLIIDYWPQPYGRSWRCDRAGIGVVTVDHREAWQKPNKPTFTGAPGGDWWHVEITPDMANSPSMVNAAFTAVFGVSTTTA